jgi:hypothetical protein
MVNRWIGVGILSAGVVVGMALAGLRSKPVVSAESKEGADAARPSLGAAACVEIASADLSIAGRYTLAVCKR